jgi:hypothetical protein
MARKKTNPVVSPTARTRTVTIAGKEHTVEFNFLAYTRFRSLTGLSLIKGVRFADLEAEEMISLLYAGLITHHREYLDNEKLFAELFTSLNGADFDPIYPVIIEACIQSFPPQEEQTENPTQPIATN